MVELKGSEKQVKWAEEIRENLLVAINDATEFLENVQKKRIEKQGHKAKRIDRRIKAINELKNEIENIEKASYLIDNYMSMTNKKLTREDRQNEIIEYSFVACNYESLE